VGANGSEPLKLSTLTSEVFPFPILGGDRLHESGAHMFTYRCLYRDREIEIDR